MSQYDDNFRPKPPRPRGFASNDRPFSNNRPSPNRPRRPGQFSAPPPRPVRPKRAPAIIAPKQPASGKERRRMLKAAAWRLAKQLHTKPSVLVAADVDKLEELVDQQCDRKTYGSNRGDALRLVDKILRLRVVPRK